MLPGRPARKRLNSIQMIVSAAATANRGICSRSAQSLCAAERSSAGTSAAQCNSSVSNRETDLRKTRLPTSQSTNKLKCYKQTWESKNLHTKHVNKHKQTTTANTQTCNQFIPSNNICTKVIPVLRCATVMVDGRIMGCKKEGARSPNKCAIDFQL